MNIRTVLMCATVAGLLAAGGTAHAQLLGGGAGGGLGGSLTGGVGNVGGQVGGTLNGSVRGTSDVLGRTRDLGSRTADRVKDQADDTANTATAIADETSTAADAAGEIGSSADAAPPKAERAPAEKPRSKAQPKPEPKAHADGKASGNNSLSASGSQPPAAQGDSSVELTASAAK